ncbi:MAG: DUF952 domain-containing protein [Cyanobacteria bacterium J069]
MLIFHITTPHQWQQAQALGEYRADSLDSEGFMHCSTAEQIDWVANTFFAGQADLLLLWIEGDRLRSRLQYDEVAGVPVANRFPHVYGPLNLDAVVRAVPLHPNAEGRFVDVATG